MPAMTDPTATQEEATSDELSGPNQSINAPLTTGKMVLTREDADASCYERSISYHSDGEGGLSKMDSQIRTARCR